jgi:hypothetical protein
MQFLTTQAAPVKRRENHESARIDTNLHESIQLIRRLSFCLILFLFVQIRENSCRFVVEKYPARRGGMLVCCAHRGYAESMNAIPDTAGVKRRENHESARIDTNLHESIQLIRRFIVLSGPISIRADS